MGTYAAPFHGVFYTGGILDIWGGANIAEDIFVNVWGWQQPVEAHRAVLIFVITVVHELDRRGSELYDFDDQQLILENAGGEGDV